MTVCVASIFLNSCVLGASDRMITSGNVEFEPPHPKIRRLTNSIVVMMAGDMRLHSEIGQIIKKEVDDKISKNPEKWLTVREVAHSYAKACNDIVSRYASDFVLSPLGLDAESFISKQREMNDALVENLRRRLSDYRNEMIGDIEAIITGVDGDHSSPRPHIYVMEKGRISCADDIGFAAIGVGYWHADSQFMFEKYTRSATAEQALINTYWAKKRAEVAPGVGSETDLFTLGPALGVYADLTSRIPEIDKIYQRNVQAIKNSNKKIEQVVAEYIENLSKPKTNETQSSGSDEPAS